MTNAAAQLDEAIRASGKRPALWLPDSGTLTFGELDRLARRAAAALVAQGLGAGDKILLFVDLSFDLYAWLMASSRLGVIILLVEPWMPLAKLERILASQKPKAFVTGRLGRLWGLRLKAVRQIRGVIGAETLHRLSPLDHGTVSLAADHPCIIAFTSGSTGEPKGTIRSHGFLGAQLLALNDSLGGHLWPGPDLCIFANFALANLANGRLSLIIPGAWKRQHIEKVVQLRGALAPETMTAGPAFLGRLLELGGALSLKSINIGGAPTDNGLFERAFALWPDAQFTHVYGSSEAEPVAHCDARVAVRSSRDLGHFQTLCVGEPWHGLSYQLEPDRLWIAGPHVSPEYLENDEANRLMKRRDAAGLLWHRMGDRIEIMDGTWYFAGRDHQPKEDFDLEQRLYSALGHSRAMVERSPQGQLTVYVESPHGTDPVPLIRAVAPDVDSVRRVQIVRDPRHRARIDRSKTTKRSRALWQRRG